MERELKDFVRHSEARAEEGIAESQYDLGLLYSTGKGVPLDYVTAHKWFNLAALRGMADAREHRAELAGQMSSGDVNEALRLARGWIDGRRAPAPAATPVTAAA